MYAPDFALSFLPIIVRNDIIMFACGEISPDLIRISDGAEAVGTFMRKRIWF